MTASARDDLNKEGHRGRLEKCLIMPGILSVNKVIRSS